jgi:hypothetical protein
VSGAAGGRPGLLVLGVPGFVFEPGPAAPCRADPEAYFASGLRSTQAARLCAGCGYRDDCGAYALEQPALYGVWGGMTRGGRATARRRRLEPERGLPSRLPAV